MATTVDIFNKLVADGAIKVRTGTQSTHDNLRIRLVKAFSTHKKLLNDIGASDGTDNSLGVCATFHLGSGISTFTLQIPKKSKGIEYEIIPH